MSRYRRQLEAAVRAAAIRQPATCYWYGVASPPVPRRLRGMLNADTARDHLVAVLSSLLYANFYCPGAARPAPPLTETAPPLARGRPSFVHQLRQANTGRGYLVDGWRVEVSADGTLIAGRDGLRFQVDPGDVVREGTAVSLQFPKDIVDAAPGFYLVASDERFQPVATEGVIRLYWNLEPAGAVRFLAAATSALNQAGLGFRLKTVNDPVGFDRCDNTVLYLRCGDYPAVVDLLKRLHRDSAGDLRAPVPAFTKLLVPGVGLAEDPGPEDSFGSHRCRLMAQGIVQAYERRDKPNPEAVLAAVEDRLTEAGIDPRTPYLNPGSRDDFAPWTLPAKPADATRTRATHRDGAFLDGARRIADQLCRQAIWYHDRCTWLGRQSGIEHRTNGLSGRACRSLGPNLHQGTSGVGLFLAELAAHTGDRDVRRTALGALRHALAHCDTLAAPVHLGLYTGSSGVAYAAARAGRVLGDEEMIAEATLLVKTKMMTTESADTEHDLLSGTAGAVVALLRLADLLVLPGCVNTAVHHADILAAAAHTHQYGSSWPAVAAPGRRNLTGLSHGTAGVGSALVALFGATGDTRHRTVAERAFEYERHWYDDSVGNWPDFRSPSSGRRHSSLRSYALAWCHGAPGIALSRLHAARILGDPRCLDEARVATATTCAAVRHDLQATISELSLCHGTVGNADVLLSASEALPDRDDGPGRLARQAGEAVLDGPTLRHDPAIELGPDWIPGLMQGLAGVGLFLLRLHDISIPSSLDIFTHR